MICDKGYATLGDFLNGCTNIEGAPVDNWYLLCLLLATIAIGAVVGVTLGRLL